MSRTDQSKTRLLVISPTFPYPLISGGKQRIYYVLRELSRNHEITLLTLAEEGEDNPEAHAALSFLHRLVAVPISQKRYRQVFRLLANVPRWILGMPAEALVKRSPKLVRTLHRLLAEGSFDVVQVEFSQFIPLIRLCTRRNLPTILVAHDISFVSQRRKAEVRSGFMRLFWAHEASAMERLEIKGWQQARRVVAMSQVDRRHILERVRTAEVNVVPNGVDTKALKPLPEAPEPTLVYVGWMRHLPNRDAVSWFVREIWPEIRARNGAVRFVIVGQGLGGSLLQEISEDNRIDCLGFVSDIANLVGNAWVSVVPIRIGSGSRLKILEAMALGTPIVSTHVGCEGIEAQQGEHLLTADHPQGFAQAVLDLLSAPNRRAGLAIRARRLVESTYSWDRIGLLAGSSVSAACHPARRRPSGDSNKDTVTPGE